MKSNKKALFLDKYCSIVNKEDDEDDKPSDNPDQYIARCTKEICREKKISGFAIDTR